MTKCFEHFLRILSFAKILRSLITENPRQTSKGHREKLMEVFINDAFKSCKIPNWENTAHPSNTEDTLRPESRCVAALPKSGNQCASVRTKP